MFNSETLLKAKKCWQAYIEMIDVCKQNGLEMDKDLDLRNIENYFDKKFGEDVMDFVLEHFDDIV